MRMLVYIWRNVTRNKVRSGLTILSVGFSLALTTILYGYLAMQEVAQRRAQKHDRLVVLHKVGFYRPVPIAHLYRIGKLKSVAAVSPSMWFGGSYKSQFNPFAQFGVDPDQIFEVFSEYEIAPDQLEAFKNNKRGCVADKSLAEKMGWELGERIPLEGTYIQYNLDLTLVGVYEASDRTGSLWFNWFFLDEELKKTGNFSGNAGTCYVRCKTSDEVPIVAEEIDTMFANSENATRTRSQAAFQRIFQDRMGDVQSYIKYITLAVIVALSLVTSTSMAMSMRERTTEVAVLKAIGFSKLRVLAMVLGESTMIAMLGGMIGIVGGLLVLNLLSGVPAAAALFPIPVTNLAGPWLFGLVLIASGIGFVSGVIPAVSAAQLSVVEGLRRVV